MLEIYIVIQYRDYLFLGWECLGELNLLDSSNNFRFLALIQANNHYLLPLKNDGTFMLDVK